MKDFLDIDYQIDLNIKAIDELFVGYNKTQNKISILVLFYSLISIYLVPLLLYLFSYQNSVSYYIILTLFISLLVLLVYSLIQTCLFIKPDLISFKHNPKVFYKETFNLYKEKLETDDSEVINEYIKVSYLNHLEDCIEHNELIFKEKSKNYYKSFITLTIALIFYFLCVGIMNFNLNSNNNMAKETKKTHQEKPKVQIDPNKVIKVEPKLIRENFSKTEKKDKQSN